MKIKKTLSVLLAIALCFSQSVQAVKTLVGIDPKTGDFTHNLVDDCDKLPTIDAFTPVVDVLHALPLFVWLTSGDKGSGLYIKDVECECYSRLRIDAHGVVVSRGYYSGAVLVDSDKPVTPEERAFRTGHFEELKKTKMVKFAAKKAKNARRRGAKK